MRLDRLSSVARGLHVEAVGELRSLRGLQATAVMRFNAVILLSRCARLASEDESLDPAACVELAERYERELLEALRWAVAGGFRDRAWLERCDELDRFRDWPELQEIVRQIR